jgi:hypothetical protein
MNLNNIDDGYEIIKRALLMMKYDSSMTSSENSLVIKEQYTFKPEETFGKCLNKLTFTPISTGTYNENDSVSKNLNKWAKSIGESFSFQLYQKSGWGSKKFNENFTKCKGNMLSINSSFKQDLDRYKKDFPSLPNSPYFCYNQNAIQNRWNAPIDENIGIPNYVNELSKTFGTLDTCVIWGMLNDLPKFDWRAADKKDWENILIGLSIGSMVIPGIGIYISLASDLALSGLYYSQGKNYDAGLTLAFAIIPFGQIANKIPGVKQLGENGFKKLLRKVTKASTTQKYNKLSDIEKETLKNMINNKEWAISTVTPIVKKMTIYELSKLLSLEQLLKIIYKYIKWGKKNPFKNMLIQIGGIWYTYDKLSDIYGIKNIETKNDTKIKELESQTTNEVMESTLKEIDSQLTDKEFNDFMVKVKENLNKK